MRDLEKYVQGFDELNTLVSYASESEVREIAETLLILAYKRGIEDTEDDLDYFFDTEQFTKPLQKSLDKKIEGKGWRERLDEHIVDGNAESVKKLLETEYHRIYNEASMDVAERIQKATGHVVTKRWVTVKDDKVRATHEPLEGLEKPLNEKFYTIDGDSALSPGGFENASNNINCRCVLEFK